jgi:hypothetical protein
MSLPEADLPATAEVLLFSDTLALSPDESIASVVFCIFDRSPCGTCSVCTRVDCTSFPDADLLEVLVSECVVRVSESVVPAGAPLAAVDVVVFSAQDSSRRTRSLISPSTQSCSCSCVCMYVSIDQLITCTCGLHMQVHIQYVYVSFSSWNDEHV